MHILANFNTSTTVWEPYLDNGCMYLHLELQSHSEKKWRCIKMAETPSQECCDVTTLRMRQVFLQHQKLANHSCKIIWP